MSRIFSQEMKRTGGRKSIARQLSLIVVILLVLGWTTWFVPSFDSPRPGLKSLPRWQSGFLDIHHLRVGASVSTFVVFPDGTTLLMDAGDRNFTGIQQRDAQVEQLFQPAQPPNNDEKPLAEGILDYMRHSWPQQQQQQQQHLDYALLTHFHADHMGTIADGKWPKSKSGNFLGTGITWIAEHMSIGTFIDRNYPDYNVPIDLNEYSQDMRNYLNFVKEYQHAGKIKFESFQVGSYQQIRPLHETRCSDEGQVYTPVMTSLGTTSSSLFVCQNFRVRNIKANLAFSPALPDNSHVFAIPDTEKIVDKKTGKWNENKLSTAVVIEYGTFSYYNGPDQEHRDWEGSPGIDTVTPVAMAAGKVNVATLNHHGYGINDAYFSYLDPQVMILPGHHLRHPPKVTSPVLTRQRDNRRHWFSTYIHPKNEVTQDGDLIWDSSEGHVVVRVYPPFENDTRLQEYKVFVLDGQRRVQSVHGPYVSI